jgi:alkyl hydroperoxide reductase subunit AhpF
MTTTLPLHLVNDTMTIPNIITSPPCQALKELTALRAVVRKQEYRIMHLKRALEEEEGKHGRGP